MQKAYKVEVLRFQRFVFDALADSQEKAEKIGLTAYKEAVKNGMEHYNEYGDAEEIVSCVYDVSGTDDDPREQK